MNLQNKYNCVIVGCGRSGSSMLAGSIYNSGYHIGGEGHRPDEGNPKGYFETKLVNSTNDNLLFNSPYTGFTEGSRHGWLATFPLDQKFKIQPDTKQRILMATANKPFCLKDPRFSYTLPVWRPFLQNTKYICLFRHPSQVINSILSKTKKYGNNFYIDKSMCYDIWFTMYKHILEKHSKEGEWLFIHYYQILFSNGLDKISEFLNTKIKKDFIDKNLCRSEISEENLPFTIKKIYNQMCDIAELEEKI